MQLPLPCSIRAFRILSSSFLLATCRTLFLTLTAHDLAQHHHAVAIHEGDTRETLAVLESIADQRLLGLEGAFGHLVGLQRVGFFHFFPACLFPHFPHPM